MNPIFGMLKTDVLIGALYWLLFPELLERGGHVNVKHLQWWRKAFRRLARQEWPPGDHERFYDPPWENPEARLRLDRHHGSLICNVLRGNKRIVNLMFADHGCDMMDLREKQWMVKTKIMILLMEHSRRGGLEKRLMHARYELNVLEGDLHVTHYWMRGIQAEEK